MKKMHRFNNNNNLEEEEEGTKTKYKLFLV